MQMSYRQIKMRACNIIHDHVHQELLIQATTDEPAFKEATINVLSSGRVIIEATRQDGRRSRVITGKTIFIDDEPKGEDTFSFREATQE